MRTKALAVFQAAFLGILLTHGGGAWGQDTAPTTTSQLNTMQDLFDIFLKTGEQQYQTATNSKAKQDPLWQKHAVIAKIRLTVVYTMMDGNKQGVPPYESEIGRLKKFFRQEAAIKRYTDNYLALRKRADQLQREVAPLLAELSADWLNYANKTSAEIVSSRDPWTDSNIALKELDSTKGPPQTNPDAADAFLQALQSAPLDPMSEADAKAYKAAYDARDLATLLSFFLAHLRNAAVADSIEKLLQTGPGALSPAEAKRMVEAFASGDQAAISRTAADIGSTHPNNPFFKPGGALSSSALNSFGGPSGGAVFDRPRKGDTINASPGQIFDEREWFDEQGRLKKKILRAGYTDFKGGQIFSEKILTSNPKKEADGSFTVTQTEEPSSGIDWLFTIKETKRAAVGQGWTVSFQLVNDDPGKAAFEVSAWEGPDGKKESSNREFTVTFPTPGKYTVKAYGKTGKYHSDFVITLPVQF
jgi:hypothetical protein